MILKETNDYTFVKGHSGEALMRNNVANRHEIWVHSPVTIDALAWVFYRTVFWLRFDHIVPEKEVALIIGEL